MRGNETPFRDTGGAPGSPAAVRAGGAATDGGITMRKQLTWTFAAALLASCSYEVPDEVLTGVTVATQGKPDPAGPDGVFDFGSLDPDGAGPLQPTFYIDPNVNVVDDGDASVEALPVAIGTQISDEMTALGYEEVFTEPVTETANAVAIKVSLLTGTGAVYYPGYWCGVYWYYYGCYYSWYYAGSYRYGTVILEMADLSAPADGRADVLWQALLYGIAYDYSTTGYNTQRINEGIARAFGQSPYLATGY
jgi:hypothetical protein